MLVFLVASEYLIYKKNPQIAGSYKNSVLKKKVFLRI